jgi:glycosyltransferase involved in cell wall biosynthesis
LIRYKLLSLKTPYHLNRFYIKNKKSINKNFFYKEKFKSFFLLNKKSLIENSGGNRSKGLFKKTLFKMPLVSIIMPNYKSATLEKSIKSVLRQDYPNIEFIVIDGNSGFEQKKIIKKYEKYIDYWISEKDRNLWDAWNKGIQLSTGDYIGIVDSTNILNNGAITKLVNFINKNPEADFFFAPVEKSGKIYSGFKPKEINLKFNIYPSAVVGFYIKLKSLKKVGLYNINYKINSDYDLIYRLIVHNKMVGININSKKIFGSLGDSGISKKYNFFIRLFYELKIRYDNKQNIFIIFYIFFGRCYKKIYNSIFNKDYYYP